MGNIHDIMRTRAVHDSETLEQQSSQNAFKSTSQLKKTVPKLPPRAAKTHSKTPPKLPPRPQKEGANAVSKEATIPTIVAKTTSVNSPRAVPPIPAKTIHKPLPLPPFRAKLSRMNVKEIEKILDEKLTNIKTAIQTNNFFAPNTKKLSKEVIKDICEVYIGKDVLREKKAEVSSDLKEGLVTIAGQFQQKFLEALSVVKTRGNLTANASIDETLQWYGNLDTTVLIEACRDTVPEIFDTALPLEFRKRLSDGLFMKTSALAHEDLTNKGLEKTAASKRAALTNSIIILFESFKNTIK